MAVKRRYRGRHRKWQPGDPCGQCGSTDTYLDDDGVPACRSCQASDADE